MSRVSIALVVVALTQSAQPVRERYLDAAQLQDFLVRTPLEGRVLQYALGRLTAAANAPYGLELEPEPPLPPRVARRSSDPAIRLDIGAVTLGEGMDQLLLHAPAYRWYEAAGVINVQPRRFGNGGSFLDRPIGPFAVRGTTARRAVEALHRVFDPEYPAGAEHLGGGMSVLVGGTGPEEDPREMYARRDALDRRLLDLSVPNATARDVLNQIVAAHGEAAWTVDYAGPEASYATARITLILGRGHAGTGWEIPFPSRSRPRIR
jgi:hypothetical protein